MNNDIDTVRADVDELMRKNRFLAAEVLDLRTGTEALEERARSDLGMILGDETFFQVIEAPGNNQSVEPYSIAPDSSAPSSAGVNKAVDLSIPAAVSEKH